MGRDRVYETVPVPPIFGVPLGKRPDKTVLIVGYPENESPESPLLLEIQRVQKLGYNIKIIAGDVGEAYKQLESDVRKIDHVSIYTPKGQKAILLVGYPKRDIPQTFITLNSNGVNSFYIADNADEALEILRSNRIDSVSCNMVTIPPLEELPLQAFLETQKYFDFEESPDSANFQRLYRSFVNPGPESDKL